MKKYDKLIRDKIPQIIAADNKKYEVEVMEDEEYAKYLKKKLLEEAEEYIESGNVEEIADILEVIYAIIELNELSLEEVEELRRKKADKRGNFEKRLKLLKVFDS